MKQHSNRHAARTAGQKEKSRKNTQLPKTHITPGARVLAVVLLVALLALHKLGEIQPFVIGSSQLLVHQHFIRLHKTMAGVSEWVHCPFQSASQPLKLTHTHTHMHTHARTHTHTHSLFAFSLCLGSHGTQHTSTMSRNFCSASGCLFLSGCQTRTSRLYALRITGVVADLKFVRARQSKHREDNTHHESKARSRMFARMHTHTRTHAHTCTHMHTRTHVQTSKRGRQTLGHRGSCSSPWWWPP